MKKILTFLLLLCASEVTFAQKPFRVTLKLDPSIDPKNLNYNYFDGKVTRPFKGVDTVIDTKGRLYKYSDRGDTRSLTSVDNKKHSVTLKGSTNSLVPYISLTYVDYKQNETYFGSYFIDDTDAVISLYHQPNINLDLRHKTLYHARPVYDTVQNKIYKELRAATKDRNLATWRFQQDIAKHPGNQDSLNKIYLTMVKDDKRYTLQFLKKYPNSYYSFFYFTRLVVGDMRYTDDDTREQLAYFRSTFPKKFTESLEGKEFARTKALKLSPLKAGMIAPVFTVKDINGRTLKLSDLKGKIVLLDFWATWCGPCLQQIPYIKQIRKTYPPEKLAIIGISRDRDIAPLKKMIKEAGMDWIHYYDENTPLCRLYGVDLFPTLMLLDREGKIIHVSDPQWDDKPIIERLLKERIM